jgi:hypothetical protein
VPHDHRNVVEDETVLVPPQADDLVADLWARSMSSYRAAHKCSVFVIIQSRLRGWTLDHVGCHLSHSMRPRICRNRSDVKELSAKTKTE